MPEFSDFEKRIGVTFSDKHLLTQAFVHRSYINENPGIGLGHNERLEFLGDAVLQLVTTDYLYKKYPDKTEGDLTAYRAALVNAVIIGEAAAELGMNDYLLLSKGEMKDTGKARQYILANVFESVVGAIYLDQGYAVAERFILGILGKRVESIVRAGLYKDSKSHIQEKAQEHVGVTPSYKVLKEAGPDHDKVFTVGIYFGDELVAEGKGRSKQEAEQKAASAALSAKRWS